MEEVVRHYLARVVEVVREAVAGPPVAIWAVGSLATGDFDPRCSDLDLMAVLARPLRASERESLARRLSHSRLECPAHGLDFIVYVESELRKLRRTPRYEFSLSTGSDWNDEVGMGGPYRGGIPDLELARTRGLPLVGSHPGQVLAPVPLSWMKEEAVGAIRWHQQKVHDPFHDPDGANAVFNACRASRLMRTGELVSKSEGARWMLGQRDEEVVEAALRARTECRRERLDCDKVLRFLDSVLSELSEGTASPEVDADRVATNEVGKVDQAPFYDDIAEWYHLIYADWEGSMLRHGEAIAAMLGDHRPSDTEVLDVSAGIGTQSLPLASLGYRVVARDLSTGAIARLRREAAARGVDVEAGCCDMREVRRSVSGAFDAVISFDNSVPHLGTDEEISRALSEMVRCLREDGVVLISVRDYGPIDRSRRSVHRYGEHVREGVRQRMSQEWEWTDDAHYETTMVVEEDHGSGWEETLRTKATYYAITLERLESLMKEAGLEVDRVREPAFFQPVLRGRAG